MRVHWMRRIYGDAGHLQRLFLAVKTASEYRADNLRSLCEIFLRNYRKQTAYGQRKRGLLTSEWRSAEPHFSFARELDLLEWKERERWRLSFGAGQAFLKLWNEASPPKFLLLHQLLTYDRTFTVPFTIRLVEADYDFSSGRFVGLENRVKEVWQEIWELHGRELQNKEPPLPNSSEVRPRTLLHHASARIRFLNKMEGLGLTIEKMDRLAKNFLDCTDSEAMPDDSFFRIGAALGLGRPLELGETETKERALEAFVALQRAGYASGYGIYLVVNEKSLPQMAVGWQNFANLVRRERIFSTSASFRADDFLVAVEAPAKEVRSEN